MSYIDFISQQVCLVFLISYIYIAQFRPNQVIDNPSIKGTEKLILSIEG